MFMQNLFPLYFSPDDNGGKPPGKGDDPPADDKKGKGDDPPPVDPAEEARLADEAKKEQRRKEFNERKSKQTVRMDGIEQTMEDHNTELQGQISELTEQIKTLTTAMKPENDGAGKEEKSAKTIKALEAKLDTFITQQKEATDQINSERETAKKVSQNATELETLNVKEHIVNDYKAGVLNIPDKYFDDFDALDRFLTNRDGYNKPAEEEDPAKPSNNGAGDRKNVPFDVKNKVDTPNAVSNDGDLDPDVVQHAQTELEKIRGKVARKEELTAEENANMLQYAEIVDGAIHAAK